MIPCSASQARAPASSPPVTPVLKRLTTRATRGGLAKLNCTLPSSRILLMRGVSPDPGCLARSRPIQPASFRRHGAGDLQRMAHAHALDLEIGLVARLGDQRGDGLADEADGLVGQTAAQRRRAG